MGKAKRGGVFGMIRGSVGPATYSIGKDGAGKKQQIIREKPVEVFNPRTRAQAVQRIKMVPITYAMRILGDIVDHSFVGVEVGWPSKRHFMSLAMKENDIPFIPKGSLDRAIGGYVISEGTVGRVSPFDAINESISSAGYGKNAPAVLFWKGTDEYGTLSGTTWADISTKLIANSNGLVQDGDEIAVLTFVTKNTPSANGLELVKRRMLLDTHFSTDTPDDFKITVTIQEQSRVVDLNVLWAFSQYNPTVDITHFKSAAFAQQLRASEEGYTTFIEMMGFRSIGSESEVDYLTFIVSPFDYAKGLDESHETAIWNMVPQTAAEAAQSGKLAAVAMIISRREGDNWNYTISDIHLTTGYLQMVNNADLLERALQSYMNETVSGNQSASDLYLQLSEDEFTSYDISSFRATGSVEIDGTATDVYANISCRINPADGKFVVFVDNDGYVTMEGIDLGSALAMRGVRWKKVSNNQYISIDDPYVKVDQITNNSNVIYAQEV